MSQETRSYRRVGAAIGAAVGFGSTYFVLNSGGSTSLCDESANQDAAGTTACIGLYVLGGLVGAGLGSIVGGAITVEAREVPAPSLSIGVRIQLNRSSDA